MYYIDEVIVKVDASEVPPKPVVPKVPRSGPRKRPRNVICDVCNRAFRYRSELEVHFRSHTGERPFKCDICHKAFLNHHNLAQHVKVHSDEKTFVCDFCGEAFKYYSAMWKHKRTHADVMEGKVQGKKAPPDQFQCDSCEKVYANPHSLYSHKKVHAGERPFTCEYCGKSFFYKHVLVDHEKTHTKERPYECWCSKSFSTRSALCLHRRKRCTFKETEESSEK